MLERGVMHAADEPRGIVITGAAQGIGRAVAERFAASEAAGTRFALFDVDATALAHAADALRVAHPGIDVLTRELDVADADAVAAAADAVALRWPGGCDVLVSNAGVLLRGPLDAADALAHWRRTLAVNLDGCFYLARAFAPQLRASQGCIVNVASIHAFVAVRNSCAYTASKGGVRQLTQALALELGDAGVRVNAVAPGLTATHMTQATRADPAALEGYLARLPLRRVIEPADVAAAVHFLASPDARCITGVTLPVDAGYCAT